MGTSTPRFANEAELEYAKILDYYGVPWLYEPRTFVLERDEDGRVLEAFTPDFYLPEQDLYLEMTVMKQSLVTRKNRKLRKLRERYPGGQDQALLRARLRAPGSAIRADRQRSWTGSRARCASCERSPRDDRIGEVYLTADGDRGPRRRAGRRDRSATTRAASRCWSAR